jgi:16S rRNA (adenine1518-N6/adenine1519-N6)-dimethyltransferase
MAAMTGNLRPNKALGQHFLSDPSILSRIVSFAGVRQGDNVLEIGPGPGALTGTLLEVGARVIAIETDRRMVAHLRQLYPSVTIIEGDALKIDYLALCKEAGGPLKLVANLPYNISGPLTAKLLKERRAFTTMTLMYQREVAERIAASPGGRTRGNLSVMAQAFCSIEMGFTLPPGAFRPPPKVESAVIKFTVLDQPVRPLTDEALLWRIVSTSFQQRRKMLRKTLKRHAENLDAIFAAAGLIGTERPEELSSETWIELVEALGAGERSDPK